MEGNQCQFELLQTLYNHSENINALILLDDNRFASCSGDKTINIYSIDSFKLLSTMKGHKQSVYDICKISNQEIISCSSDHTIRVWDTVNYKCRT